MSDFGGDFGGDYGLGSFDNTGYGGGSNDSLPLPPGIPDGWQSGNGFVAPPGVDVGGGYGGGGGGFGGFLPSGAGMSSFIGNSLSQAASAGINRAISGSGGGGTRIASPVTTNVNPVQSQAFGLSNNPQFSMLVGPGSSVGNALSSPVNTSPITSPTISTPTTNTASQNDSAGGLPGAVTRSTVPALGASYGVAANPLTSLLNNPLMLLLLVGGAMMMMLPQGR